MARPTILPDCCSRMLVSAADCIAGGGRDVPLLNEEMDSRRRRRDCDLEGEGVDDGCVGGRISERGGLTRRASCWWHLAQGVGS
jgi:hypothetical protein